MKATFSAVGLNRNEIFVKGKNTASRSAEVGNFVASNAIRQGKPFCFGRLGTPEANACLNSFEVGMHGSRTWTHRLTAQTLGLRNAWDANVRRALETLVGYFPTDESSVERFVQRYTEDLGTVDAMAYWGWVPGENFLISRHCPDATLYAAGALEPYLFAEPWSKELEGKRVLVIHPFAESILSQYAKREYLFENKLVLPQFHLRTVKAVQSLAGTQTPFNSWFEALEWMQQQMEAEPFDVCLVGAGSYGLSLCAHAKRLGAVSLQIGGGLQILFGIIGKRWEGMPHISTLFNEHWVRPSASEQIPAADKIEDGCYW